jgi:hypothetical protein
VGTGVFTGVEGFVEVKTEVGVHIFDGVRTGVWEWLREGSVSIVRVGITVGGRR